MRYLLFGVWLALLLAVGLTFVHEESILPAIDVESYGRNWYWQGQAAGDAWAAIYVPHLFEYAEPYILAMKPNAGDQ